MLLNYWSIALIVSSRDLALGKLRPKDLRLPTEFPCMVGKKTAAAKPGAPRTSSGNYCSECKCENMWQRRFCRICGSGLTKSCTTCQFSNGVLDQFCGGCGGETSVTAQSLIKKSVPRRPPVQNRVPTIVKAERAPCPPASNTDLAKRLAALNVDKVQKRQVAPPPAPGVKPKKDEIGQEQIDALFG